MDSNLYKNITDLIAHAQDRGYDIVSYLDNMSEILAFSEIPETDLIRLSMENSITGTERKMDAMHNNYHSSVRAFVRALQKYINSFYIDGVNAYLLNNSILVKQTFADISEDVGYIIDAENIESVS